MTAVVLTVYGHPEPAGSKRAFTNAKTGRAIVTDDTGRHGKIWRMAVQSVARDAMGGRPLLEGPLTVRMTFFVRRPKGHFSESKSRPGQLLPSAPLFPTSRPDVLKLARAVEDALTGIAWRDDAQIVVEVLAKRYGVEERAEVAVSPADVAETWSQPA